MKQHVHETIIDNVVTHPSLARYGFLSVTVIKFQF
jgi:hypothetical protein